MYPPIASSWFDSLLVLDADVPVPVVDTALVIQPVVCHHSVVHLETTGHKYQTRDVLCSIDYSTELHLLPTEWLMRAFGGLVDGISVKHSVNVSSESPTQAMRRRYNVHR